ncbi:MAG: hypothetical protein KA100_04230 [Rickettsiales bacterium]|nr:hypothetical protein [Rickettsiales bacterium]
MRIFCKICQENNEQSHSHLTPKSIIKSKQLEIHKSGKIKGAKNTGMPFDDGIICQKCERIFDDLDRKFAGFIRTIKATKKILPNPFDSSTYLLNFSIDYVWLDTFSASLLYRHSLSEKRLVKLGKFEGTAKKMIEKYNKKMPIDEEQKTFEAICLINTARKLSKNSTSTDIGFCKNYGTIRVYRFLASDGIELHIKVSNKTSPALSNFRQKNIILAAPLYDDYTKHMELMVEKSILLNRK